MLFATSVGALESLEFATACNNYNNNKQSGREVKSKEDRGAELLCHRPLGMKPESSTTTGTNETFRGTSGEATTVRNNIPSQALQ